MYYRLCKSVEDRGTLIPANKEVFSLVDKDNDWYVSAGLYTEEHFNKFKESSSVKGFTEVKFYDLFFDFDGEFSEVKNDAITLCNRLIEKEVTQDAVGIYYSGNKGFHITVRLKTPLSIKAVKEECLLLTKELKTADPQIYNDNRIFRVAGTKNLKTQLYKTELSFKELSNFSEEEVKLKSSSQKFANTKAPFEYKLSKKIEPQKKNELSVAPIDWSSKPPFLSKARFALQNGLFEEGERNTAFLCLASTYKNLGFDIEHTYRLLKGVASIQSKLKNSTRYPDEELYNNICSSVYSPTWRGGQFSEREEGNWLNLYAKRLNLLDDKFSETLTVDTTKAFSLFSSYAKNYKNNIIYSGIESLDKRCKFLVGTSNAIVASPGTGKSSLMFSMLNHNSLQGVPSVCFSLDMFHALLSMRLCQKHTGLSQDEIYRIAEKEGPEFKKLEETIQKNYENIRFCFKAGITIDEIVETIKDAQQHMGKKIKLVIVDYNELVLSDKSDPTSASADVIQSLRRIANELEVCVITLLQPSKLYSNPSDEVTSFNAAKGSSAIAQSLTLMLGMSRPGFNPLNPESDKFFNITCLKNRNGPLFSLDYRWQGLRGEISELEDNEREELFKIREAKQRQKERSGWG